MTYIICCGGYSTQHDSHAANEHSAAERCKNVFWAKFYLEDQLVARLHTSCSHLQLPAPIIRIIALFGAFSTNYMEHGNYEIWRRTTIFSIEFYDETK